MEGITISKEVGKVDTRHFRPPERLFCDKQGNPITFHVLDAPDRDVVVQLIKAGGGVVVDGDASDYSGAITISSGPVTAGNVEEVISSSYIYVCCFYGERITLEEFRFVPDRDDVADKIVGGSNIRNGTDQLETRLSAQEMHQLLVYLRKNECLWKDVEKNKVCGNWSWKTIQQDFMVWALKRFNQIKSVFPESDGCSDLLVHQTQPENGGLGESPTVSSQAGIDAGPRTEMTCEEEERAEELGESGGSCTQGRSHDSEKARECGLRDEVDVIENYVSDSEEEDVPSSVKRKRVAGRLSVVIDDGSESEWEGQETVSRALEEKDDGMSESVKGQDEGSDVVACRDKISTKKVKASRVVGRNHSVPCNQWLRKGGAWRSSGGEVATSTPVANRSSESEGDRNDDNEEAGTSRQEKRAVSVNCKQKIPYYKRLYSHKEDMDILMWLCSKRKRSLDSLKGNRIWKFMESRSVLPGRSWQSIRERFRRHIAPNLANYPIPPENKKKLLREIR